MGFKHRGHSITTDTFVNYLCYKQFNVYNFILFNGLFIVRHV